jgi:predicted TIM-barrel fold metal-dependent hydrolase
MQTIDMHVHLLNPKVKFDRLFDKIALNFADNMGQTPQKLKRDPYGGFLEGLTNSLKSSRFVKKVCLLPVDARVDENGNEIHKDRTICSSSDDVLRVYENYPDLIIPFFSINPLRKNSLELIDKYIQKGCKGAKFLQNYWGIDLNDKRFLPYYKKIRDNDIPLIIHTGSEYCIKSFRAFESIKMLKLPLLAGVKVIAAHMGFGNIDYKLLFWKNFSKDPKYFDKEYFELLKLLEKYENLYADISGFLTPIRARALGHLSMQKHIHHKILFGTDYPVPFIIKVNTLDLSSDEKNRLVKIKNPFDRYVETILNYFPKESKIFSNYKKVLRI